MNINKFETFKELSEEKQIKLVRKAFLYKNNKIIQEYKNALNGTYVEKLHYIVFQTDFALAWEELT